jgi:hypothetical protein
MGNGSLAIYEVVVPTFYSSADAFVEVEAFLNFGFFLVFWLHESFFLRLHENFSILTGLLEFLIALSTLIILFLRITLVILIFCLVIDSLSFWINLLKRLALSPSIVLMVVVVSLLGIAIFTTS